MIPVTTGWADRKWIEIVFVAQSGIIDGGHRVVGNVLHRLIPRRNYAAPSVARNWQDNVATLDYWVQERSSPSGFVALGMYVTRLHLHVLDNSQSRFVDPSL